MSAILKPTVSRRSFLAGGLTAFTVLPRHILGGDGNIAPNSKTTLACIGVGGQGMQNLATFLQFPEIQVVAVCDVNRESNGYLSWNWSAGKESKTCGREPARCIADSHYAKQYASGTYQACRAYTDYRELLAKEDVDAVMIATPDHTHAVIALDALRRHKHLYCEKPLAWSVKEVRQITEAAKTAGVATQLGNHGQADAEACVTREMITAGAIGPVREVRVSCGARFWETALYETRPTEKHPIPEALDWDLWLGPAPYRPYHNAYHPWNWRNWWDFGTGLLGDMGCHLMSTVFKALKLGHPLSIEASATKLNPETYPQGVLANFEFAARESQPPVTVCWCDGGLRHPRPQELEPERTPRGVIYVGDNGKMMGHRLIPEKRMREFGRVAPTLPRSPGHFKEFVDACRGGPPPGSNFVDHSGLLSELCMLGNVAVRAKKKLFWDGPAMRITNDTSANDLLYRQPREGWET